MDRQFFALSFGFGALLFAAQYAHAAPQACADRQEVVERLAGTFGETRRSIGTGGEAVIETYASDETGTWTIVVTTPNGVSCLLAFGDNWEAVHEPLKSGLKL